MKLIVDVSEEDYKWISNHITQDITDYRTTIRLYEAVADGVPYDGHKVERKDVWDDGYNSAIHNMLSVGYRLLRDNENDRGSK